VLGHHDKKGPPDSVGDPCKPPAVGEFLTIEIDEAPYATFDSSFLFSSFCPI
jgi:hypothetical protein